MFSVREIQGRLSDEAKKIKDETMTPRQQEIFDAAVKGGAFGLMYGAGLALFAKFLDSNMQPKHIAQFAFVSSLMTAGLNVLNHLEKEKEKLEKLRAEQAMTSVALDVSGQVTITTQASDTPVSAGQAAPADASPVRTSSADTSFQVQTASTDASPVQTSSADASFQVQTASTDASPARTSSADASFQVQAASTDTSPVQVTSVTPKQARLRHSPDRSRKSRHPADFGVLFMGRVFNNDSWGATTVANQSADLTGELKNHVSVSVNNESNVEGGRSLEVISPKAFQPVVTEFKPERFNVPVTQSEQQSQPEIASPKLSRQLSR